MSPRRTFFKNYLGQFFKKINLKFSHRVQRTNVTGKPRHQCCRKYFLCNHTEKISIAIRIDTLNAIGTDEFISLPHINLFL